MIGITITEPSVPAALDRIVEAEDAGIPAVWLTTGGAGRDALTLIAAAVMRTRRVKFGTSIIPTWPRHPVVVAQQAQVIEALAPGRLRIGVGPSHQPAMENLIGVEWRTPMRHLREYLEITKTLLATGAVDFEGEHFTAHARLPAPAPVPVMASALRGASFRVCGRHADGAITWVCPWSYLESQALPALKAAAAEANRPAPPLIVHVPVCVDTDAEAVRAAARETVGRYPTMPAYASMFRAAGYEIVPGSVPDELIDDLVVSGDEAAVVRGLRRIIAGGAGEIIAHPITTGDPAASLRAAMKAVAAANN